MCNQWQPNEIVTNPSEDEYYLVDTGEIQKPKTTTHTAILGSGGFAHTYLAAKFSSDEESPSEYFAIKVLKEEIKQDQDFQKIEHQFYTEALRLKDCKHPHVVKVVDIFQYKNQWCMVMEYVGSKTLREYVFDYSNHQLPPVLALKFAAQIAHALENVHQQDLLHRDIKPDNIIIRDETEEAVLIDFGLALSFQQNKPLLNTGEKTEGYAPVEQYIPGGKIRQYSDVYALTATLYYMLTGNNPISSLNRARGEKSIFSELESSLTTLSKGGKDLNLLRSLLDKGMELEPNKRLQKAKALVNLLHKIYPESIPNKLTEIDDKKNNKKDNKTNNILAYFIILTTALISVYLYVNKPHKSPSLIKEYVNEEMTYKIKYPDGWQRGKSGDVFHGKIITFFPSSSAKDNLSSQIEIITDDSGESFLSLEDHYHNVMKSELLKQCIKDNLTEKDYEIKIANTTEKKHKAYWIECFINQENKEIKLITLIAVKDGGYYTIIGRNNSNKKKEQDLQNIIASFQFIEEN